jgi:hypothetical protein
MKKITCMCTYFKDISYENKDFKVLRIKCFKKYDIYLD